MASPATPPGPPTTGATAPSARPARKKARPTRRLLEQAAAHYEACLALEDRTPPSGPLFDDARHNLELTRMILAEFADPVPTKPAGDPADPEKAMADPDDPFSPANAAHPSERAAGQKPAEGQKKTDQEKADQAEPKDQPVRECKQCKERRLPQVQEESRQGAGTPAFQFQSRRRSPAQPRAGGQRAGPRAREKRQRGPEPRPGSRPREARPGRQAQPRQAEWRRRCEGGWNGAHRQAGSRRPEGRTEGREKGWPGRGDP